jgi:cytochrome c-type biogenesis protein CcmH/NrfF
MRRHELDALSFVFGLVFAGTGLVLLGGRALREGLTLPWAGPLVAIALGVLIVIAARPRLARPDRPASDESGSAEGE